MYFVLPETKGVSLERMDALFGELDVVDEGEKEMMDKKGVVEVEVTGADKRDA